MKKLKVFFDEKCLSKILPEVINMANEEILELSVQYALNPNDTEMEQRLHTAREVLDLVLLQKKRLDLKQKATDSHKEHLTAKNLRNQAKLDNNLETANLYNNLANDYYETYKRFDNEANDVDHELTLAAKNFESRNRSLDFFKSINLN